MNVSVVLTYEGLLLEYETEAYDTVQDAIEACAGDPDEFIIQLLANHRDDYLVNTEGIDAIDVQGITKA